ncbi:ISAs1 family transposase [Glutamicibacter soli]|uniref:ISAs1 family transposase n=1 Tax=Glutamicibacter soli TaxID=453836 RepID=UPI003C78141F
MRCIHRDRPRPLFAGSRRALCVFTVKGNQPKLEDELVRIPWDQVPAGNRSMETKNGRRMIRTIKCVTATTGISFPHAAQALQIIRKSRATGATKWNTETVHALTSLPTHLAGPADIGGLIRGHWGIENGLHWRRDVTWHEDKSQVNKGNASQLMVILWHIAITLLKQRGNQNLARATLKLRNQTDTVLTINGLSAAH